MPEVNDLIYGECYSEGLAPLSSRGKLGNFHAPIMGSFNPLMTDRKVLFLQDFSCCSCATR